MHFVYFAPAITGYLAFVALSERLWPFSPPRGWVADRRFRKGRIVGVLVAAVTLIVLAGLLLDPVRALPVVLGGLCIALSAALQFHRFLKPSLSRQATHEAAHEAAHEATHEATQGATSETALEPPATLTGSRSPAAFEFLRTHRPDIVLGEGEAAPLPSFVGREWTSRTRFEAVVATYHADEEQRARFCREHGLERDALTRWRDACESANERVSVSRAPPARPRPECVPAGRARSHR